MDERPESASEQRRRERDEVWAGMLRACRIEEAAVNPLNSAGYQQAARHLQRAGATPYEMGRRAQAMRNTWSFPITPTVLAKHWGEYEKVGPSLPAAPDSTPRPSESSFEAGLALVREAWRTRKVNRA